MERNITLTDEEIVSRITGLPLDRIEFLKTVCGMPVSDPEFSVWAVENFETLFEEQKKHFEKLLFGDRIPTLPADDAPQVGGN
jgi:hypothetical protein